MVLQEVFCYVSMLQMGGLCMCGVGVSWCWCWCWEKEVVGKGGGGKSEKVIKSRSKDVVSLSSESATILTILMACAPSVVRRRRCGTYHYG